MQAHIPNNEHVFAITPAYIAEGDGIINKRYLFRRCIHALPRYCCGHRHPLQLFQGGAKVHIIIYVMLRMPGPERGGGQLQRGNKLLCTPSEVVN